MKRTKIIAALLAGMMILGSVSVLSACNKGSANDFTMWIPGREADQYYMDYADNPVVKYVTSKEWGDGENKAQLGLEIQSAPTGTEKDNFNMLINTQEYDDIMSLTYSEKSILELYNDGAAMDITEYVEEYMPNYSKLLENPEYRAEAVTMVDGEARILQLISFNDGAKDMYQGLMYRRDWLVRFGEMPEYIWETDANEILSMPQSERESAAPEITNYFRAMETYGDSESAWTSHGWKKNPAYEAEDTDNWTPNVGGERGHGIVCTYGSDPNNTFTDNLIFPSGTDEPIFLSDWEWMFETVEENVWNNPSYTFTEGGKQVSLSKENAYMTSVYYYGTSMQGDFSAAFGGGGPLLYLDDDTQTIKPGAIEERTRLYLEYMNGWYQKGWLDNGFAARSQDMFYQIDIPSVFAGKIFSFTGKHATQLGSNLHDADQTLLNGMMVYGARLPINDVSGDSAYKFVEPDTIYQEGINGGACMISTSAEGKNLPALFTMLDYFYSDEGAKLLTLGLSKEQYQETQDEFYTKWGLTEGAYVEYSEPDENGYLYAFTDKNPDSSTLNSAARGNRLPFGLHYVTNVDYGYHKVMQRTARNWKAYPNTGHIQNQIVPKVVSDRTYNEAYTGMIETLQFQMAGVIKANNASSFEAFWQTFKSQMTPYITTVAEYWQDAYDTYYKA